MGIIKMPFLKLWVLFISLLLVSAPVVAEDSFCATVKIEINQELTLERQAFDAHMRINNGLDSETVENVRVEVKFTDENGDPVVATSDPDNTSASFFIREDSLSGISDVTGTGSVDPQTSADIRWLIIPAPGSGGQNSNGKLYYVGATLTYTLAGEEKVVEVSPDYISVRPMPLLTLDYFLPREVYADDAFSPMIEPPIPFNLGVRVKNNGQGPAFDLKIDSAQPKIIENELGLVIDFMITGSSVGDKPVEPTLLVDIGDIPASESGVARWQMETTLSGEFVEFTAEFTHADELGGELTSLMEAVNTHELVHDVLVDLPGRDAVRDFLARDGGVVRVYESSGLDTEATNQSGNATIAVTGQDQYLLTTPVTDGFMYAKLPDPNGGTKRVVSALRGDGKVIHPDNIWFSKTRRSDDGWDHFIHIFDANTQGKYHIAMESLVSGPVAPVLQFIPDRKVTAGNQVSFIVEASDLNSTLPTISANPLPSGSELFVDNNGAAGISTYIFDWTPTNEQAGKYPISFMASDGELETSQVATITVCGDEDSDCDGMSDAWELEHFGNLDRDGTGDLDGDGFTDMEEFINGTIPTIKDAPGLPNILYPLNGLHVNVAQPELTISNATHGDSEVHYEFEVYSDEGMTQLIREVSVLEQVDSTVWESEPEFLDNTWYFWRVRTCDPELCSEWVSASFFINLSNNAPGAFQISSPEVGSTVATLRPSLVVSNSVDPEGDTVTYQYLLYADGMDGTLVSDVSGITQDNNGFTSWQPDVDLEDGRWYFWNVVASDSQGASTDLANEGSFFIDVTNTAPTSPSIVAPGIGEEVGSNVVALVVGNSIDLDDDALTYLFEIDTVNTFDSSGKVVSQSVFAGLDNSTSWQVENLNENTLYYWRAKADDGRTQSDWALGQFFVNAQEEAPAQPQIVNPGQGAWVETIRPAFISTSVEDPDGDQVTYQFEVYRDQELSSLVVAEKTAQPEWISNVDLADNQWHYWRVRAEDDTGLVSDWSELHELFVNDNGVDDAPVVIVTQPAEDIRINEGSVRIAWEDSDPDSNADISVYYQYGNKGIGGVVIAEGLSEDGDGESDSVVWDITGLSNGTYYLYAVISDANSSETSYAAGVVYKGDSQEGNVLVNKIDEFSEAGFCAAFEVAVSMEPVSDVTIQLNTNVPDLGTLSPNTITFTQENWSISQVVKVSGFNGCDISREHAYQLLVEAVESGDIAFDGIEVAPIDIIGEDVTTPAPSSKPASSGGGGSVSIPFILLVIVGYFLLIKRSKNRRLFWR